MNRTLSDSVTCGDGDCFLGESSLKAWSGGLTIVVIYFHHKHSELKFFASDRRRFGAEM